MPIGSKVLERNGKCTCLLPKLGINAERSSNLDNWISKELKLSSDAALK